MRYLLFLRNLSLDLSIGLHDFEKAAPQRIFVSAALVVEKSDPALDDVADVYDYDGLRETILAIGREPHVLLQETLCQRIVDYCRAQPRIAGGWVRSAKPDVYPDAEAVGCQIVWGDADARQLLGTAPA